METITNIYPSEIFPDNVPTEQIITADDLNPWVNTAINSIRWKGAYSDDGRQGNEGGIIIKFFQNEQSNSLVAFDHPGDIMFTQHVAGYACEMLTTNFGPLNIYKYHVNLDSPFQMNYNNIYWFSAQMILQDGTTWGSYCYSRTD